MSLFFHVYGTTLLLSKTKLMTAIQNTAVICCPRFDPIPWDGKTINWHNKHFIRGHIRTLFYMPMNFGAVMKQLDTQAGAHGQPDGLCLSDHTSAWNMDVYLAVDAPVNAADNVELSGLYYSKVYEGKFSDTGKWMKDFENTLTRLNLASAKTYMWYTTCPKCAKKYGKNYVVLLGKID